MPQKGGEKPYALLREALQNTAMVGIGKLTLRQQEHLVAVRPLGDALILELMRFEEELVAPEDLRFPDAEQQKVRPQEIAMAEQLIGHLAEPFDPKKYHDEYEEKLTTLLREAQGKAASCRRGGGEAGEDQRPRPGGATPGEPRVDVGQEAGGQAVRRGKEEDDTREERSEATGFVAPCRVVMTLTTRVSRRSARSTVDRRRVRARATPRACALAGRPSARR